MHPLGTVHTARNDASANQIYQQITSHHHKGTDQLLTSTTVEIEIIRTLAVSRLRSSASRLDRDLRAIVGHLCVLDHIDRALEERKQSDLCSGPANAYQAWHDSIGSRDALPVVSTIEDLLEDEEDPPCYSSEDSNGCPELSNDWTSSDEEGDSDEELTLDDEEYDLELVLIKTLSQRQTIVAISEILQETMAIPSEEDRRCPLPL